MVFTSCNPLEDINAEIDAQANPIVGDVSFTLTDDDYTVLDLSNGNFSSEEDAKTALPSFLADRYPVWGNGSSALVGYNLYIGNAPGVSDYTQSQNYNVASADYPGGTDNAVGFYENENPSDFVPDILSANIQNPIEGQIILAKYKQYVGQTVNGFSPIYTADFKSEGTLLDYEAISVIGDQAWEATQSYGAKISGYAGGNNQNEDWLISTEIDLSNTSNSSLQVSQVLNYGSYDAVSVLISKDYTGAASTANWEVVNLTNVPDGSSWTEVISDEFSLSAYDGEKIYVAFKYTSTSSSSATWEVFKASIKAPGVEGVTENKEAYYLYKNGTWELSQGVYYISDKDFDSMGEASGQPGRYNNFSSAVSPSNYLPSFLKNKYLYAQEGDELFVIYRYFSSTSGAQLRGNLYTYSAGVWNGFESTIATTLQFGHDGATWVPDNTIKYTLIRNTDYEYMASQLTTPEYAGLIGNLANYGDFDYNWTDEQINFALVIFLTNHDASATEGQKYLLSYVVYDNGENIFQKRFIKTNGEWVIK